MIEIKNLKKTYKSTGVTAVNDLTLSISPGSIYGLLGPNGAGKSTLIKCLVGIIKFEEGSIIVDGVNFQNDPTLVKEKIGFVPDEQTFYDNMTGNQFIDFIISFYSIDKGRAIENKNSLAKRFRIFDKLNDKISSYSHGMKQKISIIAALAHEPEIFVLDEPMTGLDPQSTHELKLIMNELVSNNKTVIFSSHVLDVVEKLCKRILIIDRGRLISDFNVEDLDTVYKDSSLEQFFLDVTNN